MKIVAGPGVRAFVEEHGGAVYLRSRTTRCCRVPTTTLEVETTRPQGEYELVHAVDGFQLFATRGLVEPDLLEFELDRRGRLRAYWNGQGWVG